MKYLIESYVCFFAYSFANHEIILSNVIAQVTSFFIKTTNDEREVQKMHVQVQIHLGLAGFAYISPQCFYPYVHVSWLLHLNLWSFTTIHTETEVFDVIFNDWEAPNREFSHVLGTYVPLTIDLQDHARKNGNHKCMETRQTNRRESDAQQVVQEPFGIAPRLCHIWSNENREGSHPSWESP